MKLKRINKAYNTAFLLFFLSVTLGLVLRLAFSHDLPEWVNFTHLRHAHVHTALLGWLFACFVLLIISVFELEWSNYYKLFYGMQLAVVLLMFSFVASGFSNVSVILKIVHTLLSLAVVFLFLKEPKLRTKLMETRFLKASFYFYIIACISNLAIGPMVAFGFKGSALYYGAIQFYLHFLLNGFFVFCLFAIFLKKLSLNHIIFNYRYAHRLYHTLVASTILTFALAITWSNPNDLLFMVNSFGAALQLLALYFLYRLLIQIPKKAVPQMATYVYNLLLFAIFCYFLKVIFQSVVIIPFMATVSYTIHNFVIGFLHLMMLGVFTSFALGIIGLRKPALISAWSVNLFFIGVFLTEFLLFGQGLLILLGLGFMPKYYMMISIASGILILSIYGLVIHFLSVNNGLQPKSKPTT